jgi:hypothetical protein
VWFYGVIGEIVPIVPMRGVAWVQNCARGEMHIKNAFSAEEKEMKAGFLLEFELRRLF